MESKQAVAGRERAACLQGVRRLVVKVGTSLLTTSRNRLDTSYMDELVEQLSDQRRAGREVVLVSSGAIAAGLKTLKMTRRPTELAALQAAAAVGQSNLMRLYERLFREHGYGVGQVLLTRDIVLDPERRRNAASTFEALFAHGIVPIVNENDAVAVEEIRFGDNDTLSALVTALVNASLLIILSDVEGFYLDGACCRQVDRVTSRMLVAAGGAGSALTVGGMVTKLDAARMLQDEGRMAIIANGRVPGVLERIMAGEALGTFFPAPGGGASG